MRTNSPGEIVPPPEWKPRTPSQGSDALWVFVSLVAVLVLARIWVAPAVTVPAVQAWATIFIAIMVQALPFLVFGVAISGAITAFVPPTLWAKVLPKHPALAVPFAGASGAILPGCECASVPVAGGLMARGVAPAAALAFLLAAPAINPIVMVATAVAFAGQPEMVVARFGASLIVSILAGLIWLKFGKAEWIKIPTAPDQSQGKWNAFREAMRHDLLHAGGYLVLGAMGAATINVVIPAEWLGTIAGIPVLSVLLLACLAVLMSICSEADAFVAVSLTQFSPTAKLAFLVVGPMVDLKLIALQTGTFGRQFAIRFIPLTFILAVGVSFAVGAVLL